MVLHNSVRFWRKFNFVKDSPYNMYYIELRAIWDTRIEPGHLWCLIKMQTHPRIQPKLVSIRPPEKQLYYTCSIYYKIYTTDISYYTSTKKKANVQGWEFLAQFLPQTETVLAWPQIKIKLIKIVLTREFLWTW